MTQLILLLANSERAATGLNMIVSGVFPHLMLAGQACALSVAIVSTATRRKNGMWSDGATSERRDGKKKFKIIFLTNHKNFKLKEIRNKFIFNIKTI